MIFNNLISLWIYNVLQRSALTFNRLTKVIDSTCPTKFPSDILSLFYYRTSPVCCFSASFTLCSTAIRPCDLQGLILLRKYLAVTIQTMPAGRRRGEPEKSSSPPSSVFSRPALYGCSLPPFQCRKIILEFVHRANGGKIKTANNVEHLKI